MVAHTCNPWINTQNFNKEKKDKTQRRFHKSQTWQPSENNTANQKSIIKKVNSPVKTGKYLNKYFAKEDTWMTNTRKEAQPSIITWM